MTFWKRKSYRNRKEIRGCQGLGMEKEVNSKEAGENLGVLELFYILIVVGSYTAVCICQNSQSCNLKRMIITSKSMDGSLGLCLALIRIMSTLNTHYFLLKNFFSAVYFL